MKMVFNPDRFNQEIADEVCANVSLRDESLYSICISNPQWDLTPREIYFWRIINPQFDKDFLASKIRQAQLIFEGILDIADDTSNDYVEGEYYRNGKPKVNHEAVNRSRLKVETRYKYLAKLLPKIYGDKIGIVDKNGEDLDISMMRDLLHRSMNKG